MDYQDSLVYSSLLRGSLMRLSVCRAFHILHCTVLDVTDGKSPISTYNRRGLTKPNVNKSRHSIVYSSKSPVWSPDEDPEPGEDPMLSPIKVVPRKSRIDDLHWLSRIDYSKIYTIEHSVKVYEVGDADKDSRRTLKAQWKHVLEEMMQEESSDDGVSGECIEGIPPIEEVNEEDDDEE